MAKDFYQVLELKRDADEAGAFDELAVTRQVGAVEGEVTDKR
ncbi:MAG TPA: hypothetical protein VF627_01845 [Abditibacterium sp.]|jgi:hypothetical protein